MCASRKRKSGVPWVRAFQEHRLVVEGGGAVGLAALWSGAHRPSGPVAVVVSGAISHPRC